MSLEGKKSLYPTPHFDSGLSPVDGTQLYSPADMDIVKPVGLTNGASQGGQSLAEGSEIGLGQQHQLGSDEATQQRPKRERGGRRGRNQRRERKETLEEAGLLEEAILSATGADDGDFSGGEDDGDEPPDNFESAGTTRGSPAMTSATTGAAAHDATGASAPANACALPPWLSSFRGAPDGRGGSVTAGSSPGEAISSPMRARATAGAAGSAAAWPGAGASAVDVEAIATGSAAADAGLESDGAGGDSPMISRLAALSFGISTRGSGIGGASVGGSRDGDFSHGGLSETAIPQVPRVISLSYNGDGGDGGGGGGAGTGNSHGAGGMHWPATNASAVDSRGGDGGRTANGRAGPAATAAIGADTSRQWVEYRTKGGQRYFSDGHVSQWEEPAELTRRRVMAALGVGAGSPYANGSGGGGGSNVTAGANVDGRNVASNGVDRRAAMENGGSGGGYPGGEQRGSSWDTQGQGAAFGVDDQVHYQNRPQQQEWRQPQQPQQQQSQQQLQQAQQQLQYQLQQKQYSMNEQGFSRAQPLEPPPRRPQGQVPPEMGEHPRPGYPPQPCEPQHGAGADAGVGGAGNGSGGGGGFAARGGGGLARTLLPGQSASFSALFSTDGSTPPPTGTGRMDDSRGGVGGRSGSSDDGRGGHAPDPAWGRVRAPPGMDLGSHAGEEGGGSGGPSGSGQQPFQGAAMDGGGMDPRGGNLRGGDPRGSGSGSEGGRLPPPPQAGMREPGHGRLRSQDGAWGQQMQGPQGSQGGPTGRREEYYDVTQHSEFDGTPHRDFEGQRRDNGGGSFAGVPPGISGSFSGGSVNMMTRSPANTMHQGRGSGDGWQSGGGPPPPPPPPQQQQQFQHSSAGPRGGLMPPSRVSRQNEWGSGSSRGYGTDPYSAAGGAGGGVGSSGHRGHPGERDGSGGSGGGSLEDAGSKLLSMLRQSPPDASRQWEDEQRRRQLQQQEQQWWQQQQQHRHLDRPRDRPPPERPPPERYMAPPPPENFHQPPPPLSQHQQYQRQQELMRGGPPPPRPGYEDHRMYEVSAAAAAPPPKHHQLSQQPPASLSQQQQQQQHHHHQPLPPPPSHQRLDQPAPAPHHHQQQQYEQLQRRQLDDRQPQPPLSSSQQQHPPSSLHPLLQQQQQYQQHMERQRREEERLRHEKQLGLGFPTLGESHKQYERQLAARQQGGGHGQLPLPMPLPAGLRGSPGGGPGGIGIGGGPGVGLDGYPFAGSPRNGPAFAGSPRAPSLMKGPPGVGGMGGVGGVGGFDGSPGAGRGRRGGAPTGPVEKENPEDPAARTKPKLKRSSRNLVGVTFIYQLQDPPLVPGPMPVPPVTSATAAPGSLPGLGISAAHRVRAKAHVLLRWELPADLVILRRHALVAGLFRYGVSSNKSGIISKRLFEGAQPPPLGAPPPRMPPRGARAEGAVPFFAPKSVGTFVFRIYDEEDPVETHAASEPWLVDAQGRDIESSMRFVTTTLRGLDGRGAMGALAQLTHVLTHLDLTHLQRNARHAASAVWSAVAAARRLLDTVDDPVGGGADAAVDGRRSRAAHSAVCGVLSAIMAAPAARQLLDLAPAQSTPPYWPGAAPTPGTPVSALLLVRHWASLFCPFDERYFPTAAALHAHFRQDLGFLPRDLPLPRVTAATDMVLTDQVEKLLPSLLPSRGFQAAREAVRERLETLLITGGTGDMAGGVLPPSTRLFIFGSTSNGFGSDGSDLDMCLVLANGAPPQPPPLARPAASLAATGVGGLSTYGSWGGGSGSLDGSSGGAGGSLGAGGGLDGVGVGGGASSGMMSGSMGGSLGAFGSSNGFGSGGVGVGGMPLGAGSIGNGGGSGMAPTVPGPSSDASTVIELVAERLRAVGMRNVDCRATARIPIVLFIDPDSGLECDISVLNPLALRNTALLRAYSTVDPRVPALAYVVKHWAKRRMVNNASEGTLSSYGYLLCLLHFLQTRDPPVVPNLQALPPDWTGQPVSVPMEPSPNLPRAVTRHPLDGKEYNTYFYNPQSNDLLRAFSRRNTESVGQLLAGFFRYYAWEFDYRRHAVSIRAGGAVDKEAKAEADCWQIHTRLSVEDPFETWYDVAHVLKWSRHRHVRLEFARAYTLLCDAAEPLEPSLAAATAGGGGNNGGGENGGGGGFFVGESSAGGGGIDSLASLIGENGGLDGIEGISSLAALASLGGLGGSGLGVSGLASGSGLAGGIGVGSNGSGPVAGGSGGVGGVGHDGTVATDGKSGDSGNAGADGDVDGGSVSAGSGGVSDLLALICEEAPPPPYLSGLDEQAAGEGNAGEAEADEETYLAEDNLGEL